MESRAVALDREVDVVDEEATRRRDVRERCRRIKAAAELGLALSSRGRQWGAVGWRALVLRKDPSAGEEAAKISGEALEGAAEEEEEVEEKVTLLRQLVPGGDDMAVDRLLEETADYIAELQAQVGVMRALACLLSGGLRAPPENEYNAPPLPPPRRRSLYD